MKERLNCKERHDLFSNISKNISLLFYYEININVVKRITLKVKQEMRELEKNC
jgi:hypothetical protein